MLMSGNAAISHFTTDSITSQKIHIIRLYHQRQILNINVDIILIISPMKFTLGGRAIFIPIVIIHIIFN